MKNKGTKNQFLVPKKILNLVFEKIKCNNHKKRQHCIYYSIVNLCLVKRGNGKIWNIIHFGDKEHIIDTYLRPTCILNLK
jgi:hypothetical protein